MAKHRGANPHVYRGKRQSIPREYRHATHPHRSGDGGWLAGCFSMIFVSLIVFAVGLSAVK
jgi:hypothetical protein